MMAKDAQRSAWVGGDGPCARLAREALDRLASPEVRDRILVSALTSADLSEVPADPTSFATFACGPLRDVVADVLGDDAASAVVSDLSPVFAADGPTASSGVRRRKGASLAAPRTGAPVVLVASDDAREVDALTARLKERAKVIAAYDVFALLSAASRHLTSPLTLLLNDGMPAVRPSTLATLARVLPPGTRIIVWGRGDVHPEKRPGTPSIEWVRLGAVEDVEAVADVCIAIGRTRVRSRRPSRARSPRDGWSSRTTTPRGARASAACSPRRATPCCRPRTGSWRSSAASTRRRAPSSPGSPWPRSTARSSRRSCARASATTRLPSCSSRADRSRSRRRASPP
ncbi:MAG: hypothetical protein M5U28_39700 [Sandaracinaceae bacterium]|nr:hypothetical protein [Sandaracinaceae bacterium]